MKKATIISLLSCACLTLVHLSFSKKREEPVVVPASYKCVNTWYTAQADSFLQQVLALQKIHLTKTNRPIFQKKFVKLRRAFKKMETLVSYFDRPVYLGINNRIKPEVELEKGTFEFITEPHGLQVIESLLADDSTFAASRKEMAREIDLSLSTARFLKTYHFTKPYTDTGFFNAIKDEMVRVASLGISGFDKPVLKDAIPETAIVLNGIRELLGIFRKATPGLPELENITFRVNKALQFIRSTTRDFDNFDRLGFTRNYLQPIFSLADKICKQGLLNNETAPVYTSFFQKSYIDQLYHQTKTYPAEIVALGKSLFESNALSANGELRCTSCHKPALDFADTVQRNTGLTFHDTVSRNTPTLLNATYHLRFQLDGHALFMQDQFKEVLTSHLEMGNISESELVKRLQNDLGFQASFQQVFHVSKNNITYMQALDALEAFVRSLVSLDSPFDRYMTYQTNILPPSIKRGYNLFMGAGKCGTCHFMPVFNGVMPPYANRDDNEVIGVLRDDDFDNPVLDKDEGLFATTRLDLHRHSFKVPSVRNLAKTAPYMHNGSLKNLNDLLIFYNVGGGGGWGFGLDVPNQSLDREPIRLNDKERKDLEAFLRSLN